MIVVNFWATWCEPCRTETPMLVKAAGEYGKRRLKVVGIALDEDASELIKKFVAEYKIDYPILIRPADSPLFRMENLPTTLLIDADGRLAKKIHRSDARKDSAQRYRKIDSRTIGR